MVSAQATKSSSKDATWREVHRRHQRANRPSIKSRPTTGTKDVEESTIPNAMVAPANVLPDSFPVKIASKIDRKDPGLLKDTRLGGTYPFGCPLLLPWVPPV